MTEKDEQDLKLLVLFHYIVGGLGALFSFLPLIHVGMGVAMLHSPNFMGGNGPPPPAFFPWIFIVMGTVFILIGLTVSSLILLSGRHIAQRRRYLFSFIIACIECAFFPFGTILGVFTIIILSRPAVKAAYD